MQDGSEKYADIDQDATSEEHIGELSEAHRREVRQS